MKSGERTVIQTAEFLAEATGLPDSSLRSISRRLREAGFLSQYGHGRGAAAATAEDAATLLLVAITELPPLHAALVARALRACKPNLESEDEEVGRELMRRAEAFAVDGNIPKDPIRLAASMIENRDVIREIEITLVGEVAVQVVKYVEGEPTEDEAYRSISYWLPFDASVADEFRQKLGGREKVLSRSHYIDGQVLLDIADWLEAEEPAD